MPKLIDLICHPNKSIWLVTRKNNWNYKVTTFILETIDTKLTKTFTNTFEILVIPIAFASVISNKNLPIRNDSQTLVKEPAVRVLIPTYLRTTISRKLWEMLSSQERFLKSIDV